MHARAAIARARAGAARGRARRARRRCSREPAPSSTSPCSARSVAVAPARCSCCWARCCSRARRPSWAGALTESCIGSVLALRLDASRSALAHLHGRGRRALAARSDCLRSRTTRCSSSIRFSALITAVIALAALLSCALSITYLAELRINHGEYYALVLFATAGMMLLVCAIDLLPGVPRPRADEHPDLRARGLRSPQAAQQRSRRSSTS